MRLSPLTTTPLGLEMYALDIFHLALRVFNQIFCSWHRAGELLVAVTWICQATVREGLERARG